MLKQYRGGLIILFCMFLGKSASGQNMSGAPGYMVTGLAVDSATGIPVKFAVTSLVSEVSKRPVDGGITDSTGKVFFIVNTPGVYLVSITAVGYGVRKTRRFQLSDSIPFISLGKIYLSSPAVSLGEVKIIADKPIIENKVDKLVYNASQDISSKGGSATDLMRKVPMVEVDMDGNVSIRGNQNVRVLIDGKPSGIVSASIKDALKTIPADQIESVEVITSPSAKYDAEGTAGIINIVLKENRLKGTNASVHAGAGNRSGNLGANVSTNIGKTGLSFRLGGHYWRNIGSGSTQRLNTIAGNTYELDQQSNNRTLGGGPYATFGLDHTINKYNSFSISANLRGHGMKSSNKWETKYGLADLPLGYLYGRNVDNLNITLGYDLTGYYRKTFKKKDREFNVGLQYNGNSTSTNYDANQDNQAKSLTYREKSKNLGLNHEYTLQTDVVEPINKNFILEAGLKTILRKVTSDYQFDSFNFFNQEYKTITSRNNDFYYNQNVYGGYGQATIGFAKHYSLRIGGRYEHTTYGGGRNDSNLHFIGQPYGNFIPFISLNRKFGYTGYLRFNYTQRLLRPSLFYLNPYTNYSDPRNLTTGNPRLRAELAHSFELSTGKYSSKGGMGLNFYHKRVNNAIETLREVDSFGVYRTTYGNVGLNYNTGMDFNVNLRGKKYMINLNAGLGYVNIKSTQTTGITAGLNTKGMTYNAGLWGNYRILSSWTVEAFARINAPSYSLQGKVQNWYFHSIGIKRRFNNDKGGIGVGVDNPLTPHVYYTTSQSGPGFTFTDKREINMLGIRLNFDYAIGKVEYEQPKKKKGINNDDLKQGEGSGQGGQ